MLATRPTQDAMVRPRRGVALIVVLWTILVLAAVTAVAGVGARSSADIATARRAGSVAHAMAANGIVASVNAIESVLLSTRADSVARYRYLDDLEPASRAGRAIATDSLADGIFVVAVVDVSARLDANTAGRDGWYSLLRRVAPGSDARALANRIDEYIRGDQRGNPGISQQYADDQSAADSTNRRDSLVAALLGRGATSRPLHRVEAIDDLLEIPGMTPEILGRLAPFLTVDGNSTVNRRAAEREVLDAASGSLVDHPVRLLLVSRGWMRGNSLTREIEAVYDVADDGLHLVRTRERDR